MDHPQPEVVGVKMWMDAALKAADQLHKMQPKGGNDEGALPAEGFKGLFSVQLTKSSHPTLAELQGEIGQSSEPSAKDEG